MHAIAFGRLHCLHCVNEVLHRRRPPANRGATQPLDTQGHIQNPTGQTHAAHGESEQVRPLVGTAADLTMIGVIEVQGHDVVAELADVVLGLAVGVECHTAADRDLWMARQDRKPEAPSHEVTEQVADGAAGLHAYGRGVAIQRNDPPQSARRQRRHRLGRPCLTIGEPAPADGERLVLCGHPLKVIPVGWLENLGAAPFGPVEADERARGGASDRCHPITASRSTTRNCFPRTRQAGRNLRYAVDERGRGRRPSCHREGKKASIGGPGLEADQFGRLDQAGLGQRHIVVEEVPVGTSDVLDIRAQEYELPSRPEAAVRLSEGRNNGVTVREVLEEVAAEHQIESAVCERPAVIGTLLEERHATIEMTGSVGIQI